MGKLRHQEFRLAKSPVWGEPRSSVLLEAFKSLSPLPNTHSIIVENCKGEKKKDKNMKKKGARIESVNESFKAGERLIEAQGKGD